MKNKERYPENWADEIRPAALKKAGFKCSKCKISHKQAVVVNFGGIVQKIDRDELVEFIEDGKKAYMIYLQVHHINGNPSDNSEENLKVLCPPCHLREERQKAAITRIALQPRPYIL